MSIDVIRVRQWAEYDWLRHGFSTRSGGLTTVYEGMDLNLGFTKGDEPGIVRSNRAAFLGAVTQGARFGELVTVRQVHGVVVKSVAAGEGGLQTDEGKAVHEADCLMTGAPGVMLGIQVADCVPVLVVDVRQRVVAALHAGWRGTAAGIVEQGVASLGEEFGSRPEDLMGAIGPSIGPCCYTVGDEVRESFGSRFDYGADLFSGSGQLDLWEANRRQLLAAGLPPEHITVIGQCTACTRVDGLRKYFSHRAEKGLTGRAMGVVGIAAGAALTFTS